MLVSIPSIKTIEISGAEVQLIVQCFKLSQLSGNNKPKVIAIQFISETHKLSYAEARDLCKSVASEI